MGSGNGQRPKGPCPVSREVHRCQRGSSLYRKWALQCTQYHFTQTHTQIHRQTVSTLKASVRSPPHSTLKCQHSQTYPHTLSHISANGHKQMDTHATAWRLPRQEQCGEWSWQGRNGASACAQDEKRGCWQAGRAVAKEDKVWRERSPV